MTSGRVAGLVSTALLTTWLVSAAVTHRENPVGAPPAQPPGPAIPTVEALEVQTSRLQTRRDLAPAPQRTSRNPFKFGQRTDADDRFPIERRASVFKEPGAVPAVPNEAAAPASLPQLRLVGIAIADDEPGEVRTAAIAVGVDLLLVRVGEEVAGRYQVSAISPDVVELLDRLGGPPRRLALR